MPLFCVVIETVEIGRMVFKARNAQAAVNLANRKKREWLSHDGQPEFEQRKCTAVSAAPLESLSDLPEGWKADSTPWSWEEYSDGKTIQELLQQ